MDVRSNASIRESVSDFFYARETPYGLALIRILLPLILLCVVLPRWSHTRELYSRDGAPAPLAVNYGWADFLPEPTAAVAVGMMTVLAFCLVAACVGWHTRVSLVVAWGLYTYLNMLDCLSTLTKYSVIASHVLLLLSLSNCGAIWSVDAWRNRRHGPDTATRFEAWPRRLIQLLIGLIYFGAAFTKVHTDGFASGDQLRYWLLTNLNNTNPLGELLSMYPAVIVGMSHIAVIWQVLFLFIAWRGRSRLIMLGLGVVFHLATVWLLGLFIFPPIMITTYLAWLNERDVNRIRNWLTARVDFDGLRSRLTGLRRWLAHCADRSPLPSSAAFVLAATFCVAGGMVVEHRLDPYGVRQADGPHELQPLSAEQQARMFAGHGTIREADKFFSLELGTDTLGGIVVNRRTTYAPGECVIVQCTLVPPHDDMRVVCRLENADRETLCETALPATRDMRRVNFTYSFPGALPPGDYRFVVNSSGKDVLWRRVQLSGNTSGVLSN